MSGAISLSDLTLPALNPFLALGGILSLIAALFHVACIIGGPDWLRFFGAGEEMATMAEKGHWYPGVVTGLIAVILFGMATYAFVGSAHSSVVNVASLASAAGAANTSGVPMALPLLKWGLVAITAIFVLRGAVPFIVGIAKPAILTPFTVWSSVIVLVLGVVHLIGLIQVWARL